MAVAVVAIVVLGVMLIVMAIVRAGRRDTRSVDRYQETLRRLHQVEEAGSTNPSGDGERTSVIHVRVLPRESAAEAAERPEVVSPVRVRRRPGAGGSVPPPAVAESAESAQSSSAESATAASAESAVAASSSAESAVASSAESTQSSSAEPTQSPAVLPVAPALDGVAPDHNGVAPAASVRPAEELASIAAVVPDGAPPPAAEFPEVPAEPAFPLVTEADFGLAPLAVPSAEAAAYGVPTREVPAVAVPALEVSQAATASVEVPTCEVPVVGVAPATEASASASASVELPTVPPAAVGPAAYPSAPVPPAAYPSVPVPAAAHPSSVLPPASPVPVGPPAVRVVRAEPATGVEPGTAPVAGAAPVPGAAAVTGAHFDPGISRAPHASAAAHAIPDRPENPQAPIEPHAPFAGAGPADADVRPVQHGPDFVFVADDLPVRDSSPLAPGAGGRPPAERLGPGANTLRSRPSTRAGTRAHRRRRRQGRRLTLAAATAVVVVGVGGAAAGISLSGVRGDQKPPAHSTAGLPLPSSGALPNAAKRIPTTTTVPAPTFVASASGDGLASYTVNSASVDLVLLASGRCWVELRAGSESGPVIFSGILDPGDHRTFEEPAGVWLRLGYPNGVAVQINGSAVGLPATSSPLDVSVERL